VTPVRLMAHATVLLVEDVRRAGEYYNRQLGFEVTYYDQNPEHYAYASREHCHIHLACFAETPSLPNSEAVPPDMFDVYVYANDVDALHEELLERGAEILQAPTEQGYGLREIRVRDPDGYVLAFGKLHE
jgi:catechol 2,3-dioxygenase-like lactoylglutathione lyase family enzyme